MHTRHCIQLAERIHVVMLRELGQGLDRQRMLDDMRYSRDVLLVCDGLHDTPAPLLAHHFRRAAALPDEPRVRRRGLLGAQMGSGVVQALFGTGQQLRTQGH